MGNGKGIHLKIAEIGKYSKEFREKLISKIQGMVQDLTMNCHGLQLSSEL